MSPTRGVARIDKPGKVDMNLDTLDMEAAAPPFTFVAGGQRFVVENIEDRQWQDLMEFDDTDPEETIKMILGNDQYDAFREIKGISMRKIKSLLTAIRGHFGLGDLGEGDASPGS